MKFGRLTVVDRAPNQGKYTMWNCQCDCGNKTVVRASHLTGGNVCSCGCYRDEKIGSLNLTHGSTNTRLYAVWCSMKSRCGNPNDEHYQDYGGRGITVCDDWYNDFREFKQWALEAGYDEDAPRGQCTIDRIDVNGNYCPENCRIATQFQQVENRRATKKYTYDGQTLTLGEWAQLVGIPYKILWQRINRGSSFEAAISK